MNNQNYNNDTFATALNAINNANKRKYAVSNQGVEIDSEGVISDTTQIEPQTTTKEDRNIFEKIGGFISEATRNVTTGFVSVIEGAIDLGVGAMGEVGSWFGAETNWASDFIEYDITNTIMDSGVNYILDPVGGLYELATGDKLYDQSFTYDLSEKTRNIIQSIEQSIGTSLGAMGFSAFAGPTTGIALFGVGAGGQGMQEALNEGGDYTESLLYGITSGTVEAGVESLSGVVGNLLGTGIKAIPGMQSLTRNGIKPILSSFISEGGEEVISDLINPALQSIYNGKSIQENYNNEISAESLFETFLVGGISGSLMTGTSELVRTAYYSPEGRRIQNDINSINEDVANAYETYKGASLNTIDDQFNAYKNFLSVQENAKQRYLNLVPRIESLSQKYQNRISDVNFLNAQNELIDFNRVAVNEVVSELNSRRNANNRYRVEYVDDSNTFNGKIVDNVIYLSNNPTKATRQILTHEISHSMENNSEYTDLLDKMYNQLNGTEEFEKYKKWANQNYTDETSIKNEAITEYIADNFFKSYKDITNAFESKGMLDRFKNMIRNLRNRTRNNKLRNEYLKLFQKLNNTNVRRQNSNATIEKTSSKEYNENTQKGGRSDDFRRIQEESRREFDKSSWQERSSRNDEALRRRLSNYFRRELDSRGYNSSSTNAVLLKSNKNTEFRIYKDIDGDLFHDIFEISRTYLLNGELVDLHDNYNDSTCYLSDDGLSGFAITKNGDLISVFNLDKSKKGFLSAISSIVKDNVKTLDCYVSQNQNLQEMYTKIFDFKTASIMDYNMEYDHDNIAKNHNNPQVAFMVNTNANVETKSFNANQYDEAVAYQQSFFKNEKFSLKEQGNNNQTYKQAQRTALKTDSSQKRLTKSINNILGSKQRIWSSELLESSLQDLRSEVANSSTGFVMTSKMKKAINAIENFYKSSKTDQMLKDIFNSNTEIQETINYLKGVNTRTFDGVLKLEEFNGKTALDLVKDVLDFFNQTTRKEVLERKIQEKKSFEQQATKGLNQLWNNAKIQPKAGIIYRNYISGLVDNQTYYSFFNNEVTDSMISNLNQARNEALLTRYDITEEIDNFFSSNKRIEKHLAGKNNFRDLGLTNDEVIDIYLTAGTDGAYYNMTASGINVERKLKNNRTGKVSTISGQEITDTYLDNDISRRNKDIIELFLKNKTIRNDISSLQNVNTEAKLYNELKNIRDKFDREVGNERTNKKQTKFEKIKINYNEENISLRDLFNDLKEKATNNLRKDIYDNYLTEKDREYVAILERLYKKSGDVYVEASDIINGFHYDLKENYYPMQTDSNVLFQGIDNNGAPTVYNPSFAKARQFNSNQRITVKSATNRAYQYSESVSLYAHMTPEIIKYNNIFNQRIVNPNGRESQSIYEYINKNIDENFTRHTLTLFKAAQGMNIRSREVSGFSRLLNKARAWFSSYAIGLNLKSILSPFTSIPLVRNYVSHRSAVGGFFSRGKASFDVLLEKSPQTRLRYQGRNFAKVKSLGAEINKITEFTMKPAEKSEKTLYKYFWNVAQEEARNKGFGEFNTTENINKAVEIFEEITLNTQAQWDVINNSEFQYAGGEITKSFLVFTADIRKQLSLLFNGISKLRFTYRQYKANPNAQTLEQFRSAKRQFAKATSTIMSTMVLMTLLTQIFKFLRGSHDEDEPEEILIDTTKDFLLGQVLGLFPGVSDVVDKLINDYDIEMGALSNINSALDDLQVVLDAITTGNVDSNDIVKFINVIGRLTGIPTKNLMDNIYMPIRLFSPETAIKMKNIFYGYSSSSLSSLMNIYAEKGQTSRVEAVVDIKMQEKGLGNVSDEVSSELARLYVAGEKDVLPSGIGDTINVNGETEEVSNSAKVNMTKIYKLANEQFEIMLRQQYYISLSDEEKSLAIKKLYGAYYELAKSSVFKDYEGNKLSLLVNYIDINRIASILAKISKITATATSSRKDLVVNYINSQRMNKAEKYLALSLSGYSLSDENKSIVSNYLIGKGINQTNINKII
jgi:hypothetical protein|nr:MAG TPA: hypothetical protein [Caudoviricetes sp.]